MNILVATETLLVVVIGFLIVGLLRSHTAILRRLSELEDGGLVTTDGGARARILEAVDVRGTSIDGQPRWIDLTEPKTTTVLAFLTTGCDSCRTFWRAFGDVSERHGILQSANIVVVTKSRHEESTSRIRRLASPDLPVVMSSEAWGSFKIPGSPYFVYLEEGRVLGEGSASNVPQLLSLMEDSLADSLGEPVADDEAVPTWQTSRVNAILARAGIGPDHPSLFDPRLSIDDVKGPNDDAQ